MNPPALIDDPKSTRSLESKYLSFLGLGRTVQKQSMPPVIGQVGGRDYKSTRHGRHKWKEVGVARILRDLRVGMRREMSCGSCPCPTNRALCFLGRRVQQILGWVRGCQ